MAGFGGAVKLTGESEYKKALSNINKSLKETAAEMRLVSATYEATDRSTEALTAKENALSKQFDYQNSKAKALSAQLEFLKEAQAKSQEASTALSAALETETAKLKAIEEESGKDSEAYAEQAEKVSALSKQLTDNGKELDYEREAIKKVSVELTNANAEVVKTQKAQEALKKSSGSLTDTIESQEGKLSDLKKEYIDAVAQYGKNSKEARSLAGEIKTLSGELADNREKYGEASEAADKLDKSIEDSGKSAERAAGGGFTVFKGVLANLTTEIIKSAVDGLKELGASVVELGKNSISSFADYEQLVGGVETLFGAGGKSAEEYAEEMGISVEQAALYMANSVRAQEKVLEDAKNAYKDTGMSANEYMEAVTSFSASLISSVGGNQEVAAYAANQALKDMSDNANKMGSSLDSIQSAYQGFAKGQYTLLDNLKLGYGGTKGEMERLLKDATKFSGVEYNIDNLNDVYNAIHVIQDQMGITGTTANEASTTISGSVNMMQKSWANLLTGLASDTADIDGLVADFSGSITTMIDNILPRIDSFAVNIATAASSLIETTLPQILDKLPVLVNNLAPVLLNGVQTILTSINRVLPQLLPVVSKLIKDTLQMLTQALPDLLKSGTSLLLSIIQGIAGAIPDLIKMLPEVIKAITDTLLSEQGINDMIDTGIELLVGVIDGLTEAIPKLIEMLPDIIITIATTLTSPENIAKITGAAFTIIEKLAGGLTSSLSKLGDAASKLMGEFKRGIVSWLERIGSLGGDIIEKLKNGIQNAVYKVVSVVMSLGESILDALPIPDDFKEMAKDLIRGLWNGISDMASWIQDKIEGFGKGIVKGVKKVFGISSPSKVFKNEIGKNLALGLGDGFTDEMRAVSEEMENSIPTSFDVSPRVKGLEVPSTASRSGYNQLSYADTVNAFKEALAGVKIEMDDINMGRFVEDTVTNAIYS